MATATSKSKKDNSPEVSEEAPDISALTSNLLGDYVANWIKPFEVPLLFRHLITRLGKDYAIGEQMIDHVSAMITKLKPGLKRACLAQARLTKARYRLHLASISDNRTEQGKINDLRDEVAKLESADQFGIEIDQANVTADKNDLDSSDNDKDRK